MTPHLKMFTRVLCAIVMLICAATIAAPERQGGRFLFLIETSSAMDSNRTALRNSLHSIIESGLNGQMRYGDTIGLWTYNDALNPAFPMVVWHRDQVQDITSAVDFWMAKQKFVHRGDFLKVAPLLQNVIKSSQKLTIIWISTGNDKITGTPFDKAIDELHHEFRDDFRKQHIPFVTLLVVRKGVVVDFTVNPGDSKIRLPEVVQKESAETQVAESSSAEGQSVRPTDSAKRPTLVIKVGPSPELVEEKKAAGVVKTQTNAPVAVAAPPATTNVATVPKASAPTNIPAVATNKVVAASVTNALAPVKSNAVIASSVPTPAITSAPVAIVSNAVAPVTSVPAPVVTNNVAAISNAPATAPAAKPKPAEEPPAPVVAVTAHSSTLWIGIGVGALLVIGVIVVLVMKQTATSQGPSFISQSMTRERLNSGASKSSSDNPADHE